MFYSKNNIRKYYKNIINYYKNNCVFQNYYIHLYFFNTFEEKIFAIWNKYQKISKNFFDFNNFFAKKIERVVKLLLFFNK